jgi:hypothetical protein
VFLWSDDIGDASGESVDYSKNVYDTVIHDFPHPHLVLDHSTIQTSESLDSGMVEYTALT